MLIERRLVLVVLEKSLQPTVGIDREELVVDPIVSKDGHIRDGENPRRVIGVSSFFVKK
jgi:hypothetical protein